MAKSASSTYLFVLAGVVFAGVIALAVVKGNTPSVYDDFAQCLTEEGTTMYGAWWCPHCENQKDEFGSAFDYVTYVECSPNGSKSMSQECKDDGIEGYPTWNFSDGSRLTGEQSFETLSDQTGCELPDLSS